MVRHMPFSTTPPSSRPISAPSSHNVIRPSLKSSASSTSSKLGKQRITATISRDMETVTEMTTKRMLVRGGQVYDHDGDVHKPPVADILIEDRKIVAVGPDLAADSTTEIIDASGRLVVPGLINAHYHSHDTLCRGMFEELPLEMWLLYTLPMGQNRSKEDLRPRPLV